MVEQGLSFNRSFVFTANLSCNISISKSCTQQGSRHEIGSSLAITNRPGIMVINAISLYRPGNGRHAAHTSFPFPGRGIINTALDGRKTRIAGFAGILVHWPDTLSIKISISPTRERGVSNSARMARQFGPSHPRRVVGLSLRPEARLEYKRLESAIGVASSVCEICCHSSLLRGNER